MNTNIFKPLNRYHPNKTKYVDIENLHPVFHDCRVRNRRLLPALSMASKRGITLVIATSHNQPLFVCLATEPAPRRQRAGLRCIWRGLCGNRSRLAQGGGWCETVSFGLDRRRNRFVGNVDHSIGLDKPNLGFDFFGCVRKSSIQEPTRHV